MCRIAGLANSFQTIADRSYLIEKMCQSMAHGGPDSKGLYVSSDEKVIFGHRRL